MYRGVFVLRVLKDGDNVKISSKVKHVTSEQKFASNCKAARSWTRKPRTLPYCPPSMYNHISFLLDRCLLYFPHILRHNLEEKDRIIGEYFATY